MTAYRVSFHDLAEDDRKYNFVVMATRHKGQWVWLRQFGKDSWEIPGGHIENDETPEMAARRELWEETGAIDYTLTPICDFSIEHNGNSSYNRLFFCDIFKFGELPKSEIEEIKFLNEEPEFLTHGRIQPTLMQRVREQLSL